MVHGLNVIQRMNEQAVDSQPQRLRYSQDRPTKPGWYFCLNPCDDDFGVSEFICRIDEFIDYSKGAPAKRSLVAAWMTAPGHAGSLHEDDWSDEVLWSGPIQMPLGG
jgi:hypothetical protein